jgi:uncharacterized protein (TIGR03435 family)
MFEAIKRCKPKICPLVFSALGLALYSVAAPVQPIPSPSRFEVASIRPAAPLTPEELSSGRSHVGLKVDPARVEIRWAPLVDLVALAYGVERYQIVGPDWMVVPKPWDPHIFDIQATMPEGASRKNVPEMLQSLLEERFRLIGSMSRRRKGVYGGGK